MRSFSGKQQSQSLSPELRPQAIKRRKPDGRSEALLRAEDHRRAKAPGTDCATRRMDWLLHSAESGPRVRQDFHRPGWTTATEGRRPRSMEEDSLPERRRLGSQRLVDRSDEMRRSDRQPRIQY